GSSDCGDSRRPVQQFLPSAIAAVPVRELLDSRGGGGGVHGLEPLPRGFRPRAVGNRRILFWRISFAGCRPAISRTFRRGGRRLGLRGRRLEFLAGGSPAAGFSGRQRQGQTDGCDPWTRSAAAAGLRDGGPPVWCNATATRPVIGGRNSSHLVHRHRRPHLEILVV